MLKRNKTTLILLLFLLSACWPASKTETAGTVPATSTMATSPHIVLDNPPLMEGLTLLPKQGDNLYAPIEKGGQAALMTDGFSTHVRTNYIYFRLDESFPPDQGPITVQFEYYDEGEGLILFDYDSLDGEHPQAEYKSIAVGFRLNSLQWKTESFVLSDARFAHRQNYGADFRFSAESVPLMIREIRIDRTGHVDATPTRQPTRFPPADFPKPLGDRAAFAYYFYWYSPRDHVYNMTHAAVDYRTMDWRDVNWHVRQLTDVAESGIDVILPIYWYTPYELPWSRPGIEKLVEALEITRNQGVTPPAVGMFMDTTSSTGKDLRIESEQAYAYRQLKFFFTTVPRDYWAVAEGSRPIVWFYTATWPTAYDQSFMDYLYQHFEEDFGVRPYLVFENGWDYPTETIDGVQVKNYNAAHLQYDAGYSWGGAISPNFSPQIASIGPGYDDHAGEDRIPPSFADRRDGETYKEGIDMAIQCGSPWLAIETWNEYHEGTEIAESLQYGRRYIELSREYLAYFKQGSLPASARSDTFGETISFSAADDLDTGLTLAPSQGDGLFTTVDVSGTPAIQTEPMTADAPASYLYFKVDNGFYFNQPAPITLSITYFDEGYEPLSIDYDTAPCGSEFIAGNMYRRIDLVRRGNTLAWKTATIQISDATFAGNQNGGADFRLVTAVTPLTIREVSIEKLP